MLSPWSAWASVAGLQQIFKLSIYTAFLNRGGLPHRRPGHLRYQHPGNEWQIAFPRWVTQLSVGTSQYEWVQPGENKDLILQRVKSELLCIGQMLDIHVQVGLASYFFALACSLWTNSKWKSQGSNLLTQGTWNNAYRPRHPFDSIPRY